MEEKRLQHARVRQQVSLKPMTKFIYKAIILLLLFCCALLLVGNAMVEKSDISKLQVPNELEVPEHLKHAFIATEDKRFYNHNGLDYIAVVRASVENIKAGKVVQGGSTITQQLAKNVFLTHERTFSRKWKELFYAKKIERTFTKEEILKLYVSNIYYGEGAWGVTEAAQLYFGKSVQQLTLSESAMLAAIVKAPSYYSPLQNYNEAVERRNIVLKLMEREGYITHTEYTKAVGETLVIRDNAVKEHSIKEKTKGNAIRKKPEYDHAYSGFLYNCVYLS